MKIAIASRGLPRSGNIDLHASFNSIHTYKPEAIAWCRENLDILKNTFSGHEITTFLCSWNMQNAVEFSSSFDYSSLPNEPTKEECFKFLPGQPILYSKPSHAYYGSTNAAKILIQTKEVMRLVRDSEQEFDYVIMTRPDIRIRLNNPDEWLTDKYVVPGYFYVDFNDHLGAAPAKEMLKTWDFTDEEMREVVSRSNDNEDVIKSLLQRSGLPFQTNRNMSEYTLRNNNGIIGG